jgi:hypothetical protein
MLKPDHFFKARPQVQAGGLRSKGRRVGLQRLRSRGFGGNRRRDVEVKMVVPDLLP